MEKILSNVIGAWIIWTTIILQPFVTGYVETQSEVKRVWGQENYDKLMELQIDQISSQIGSTPSQNDTSADTQKEITQKEVDLSEDKIEARVNPLQIDPNFEYDGTLTQDQYETILSSRPVKGSTWAKITWLEFSDFGCTFCQKQHDEKVVPTVMKRFEEDLNFVYYPYPLRDSQNGYVYTDCLAFSEDSKNREIYHDVIKLAYKNDDAGQFAIKNYTEILGWNVEDLNACIKAWTYENKAGEYITTASDIFGSSWTPTNIFINNETLEYKKFVGYNGWVAFENIVHNILNK